MKLQRSKTFHTCRYFSYDQRAPRHFCHHKMKTMHQRLSATRIPAPGRNCRNGKGVIFLLSVVAATLTVGSPSTSKHLIMLTCPIRSAQHSAMARTKWAASYIQYFALGVQLPPSSNTFTVFFPLGVRLCSEKEKKIVHAVLNNSAVCRETNIICISITISNA